MWLILLLTLRLLLYLAVFVLALIANVVVTRIIRIPKQTIPGVPWVGLKDRKIFPKLRACLGELGAGRAVIEEGWHKYGKRGRPFMLPGLEWNSVVLPPHLTDWMIRQPDSVLSGVTPMGDAIGAKYLGHGPEEASVLDFTVLRRDLTRHTAKLVRQIGNEIDVAFDVHLNADTNGQWKEVKIKPMIESVVFNTTNRIFVGLPLCRSERFKKAINQWTMALGIGVLFCRYLISGPLRPFIMPVIAAPAKFFSWRAVSYLTPAIKDRVLAKAVSRASTRPSRDGQPDDMVQWIVDHNAQKLDPAELRPSNIAGKITLLNLFAFGTTTMIGTVALIDILSYKDAPTLLAELREEADRVLPLLEQDSTAIRSMTKLDSVIRETLRLHPLNAQGMIREVVAVGGLETPGGLHLPKGTHVSTLTSSMHSDPEFSGGDAAEYDPLRFYNQGLGGRQTAAVQISEGYLSFGLGKHACPGRFFAVNTMKLMLAHLLVRYDVEPFTDRPEFTALAGAMIPKAETKVKMRERSVAI